MDIRRLLALLVALASQGCPDPKTPTVDASDASAVTPDAGSSCEAACDVMKQLGCPEAKTPDGGKSCVQLCADLEDGGKFNLKPACVAGAHTVEQVRACGTVRCVK